MTEAAKKPGMGAWAGKDPGSAFALIVDEHQRLVYSLALRLTGDTAAAEDIAQETFLSAWKHLDRFRGESSLKNWLARIAVNKVRSYWRWKKLRSWVGLSDRGEDGEAGRAMSTFWV
ncbi:MAG: sigma-70 family RNA polymerase sigma factor [Elusimicrobiota bacterium]|jgi:RNA polymerase sigma-70 factor (ECF subfamily)